MLDYPAVFVVGLIHSSAFSPDRVIERLTGRYGNLLASGQAYDFSQFTDYYEPELGPGLQRRWYLFEDLFSAGQLRARKLFTNGLEKKNSQAGERQVNIDPGYVTGAKFVLASRKNEAHRIYLGEEVFAEVTLIYSHGNWGPQEWTYPDLRAVGKHGWLDTARRHWVEEKD